MKTIQDEVEALYNWVVEQLHNIEINKWSNSYTISIGNDSKCLKFSVNKSDDWPMFTRYDIETIHGYKTEGRYKEYSKTIKKIYELVEKEYVNREATNDDNYFRKHIQKIIDYNEEDEDFDFGEPIHTENLPDFPLEVGKTYLVPLKLLAKERRFEGGRGTEYYKFNYRTEDYGYRPFTVVDYRMSKEIREFNVDNDTEK